MLAVRLGAHVALLPLPRSDSALGGSARGAGDPGSTALGELVLKRGLELWLRSPGRGFDYQSHPAIVDDQPSELVAPRWLLKYAPANAWVLDAGAPGEARRGATQRATRERRATRSSLRSRCPSWLRNGEQTAW